MELHLSDDERDRISRDVANQIVAKIAVLTGLNKPKPLSVSINDAAGMLGIGETMMRLVVVSSLIEYVDRKVAETMAEQGLVELERIPA